MKYSSAYLLKRIFTEYTLPRLKTIFLAILLMIVFALCQAWQLKIVNEVYQNVIIHRSIHYNNLLPLQIALAVCVAAICSYLSTVILSYVGYGIVNSMQKDLFHHIISSDMELHYKKNSGDFTSRIINDIGLIKAAVTDVIVVSTRQLFTIIFMVAYMIYLNPEMLLVFVGIMAVIVFPITRVARRLRKLGKVGQEQNASLTSLLGESFKGIRVVKAYNGEKIEEKRVNHLIDKTLNNKIKSVRVSNINNPLFAILTGLAGAAVVYYIGHTPDEKKQAAVVTILIGLNKLFRPIKSMGGLSNTLQNALAAAERFFTVMDIPAKIINQNNAKKLQVSKGEVQISNVTFKYDEDDNNANALENISITVPAGKKVALIGHSGSGKSTIINLILRFFDPQSGSISIDGQNIQDVSIESLRNNISLVTQDVFLFDDTILANIAYGRENATQDEIIAAAKTSAAHEFIEAMPNGYNTLVGESGVRLSGGQKQRISIARAILRNTPILLLDEATSALDSKSEREFQEALDTLMQGRTTIVIAHRLSTIINSDIIYVMQDGQIKAYGTHAELIENSPLYRELYR